MRTCLTILCFCLLASFASAALAQTPDGDPPSVETDCDGEIGAAFGLCNAYCEAMDCDCPTADNPTCEPQASQTACARVKERYQRKSGNDHLPCEDTAPPPPPATCPCGLDLATFETDLGWSDDEFHTGLSFAGYLWQDAASGSAPFNPASCLDAADPPALWAVDSGLLMLATDVNDGTTYLAGVRATAGGGFECFASNDAPFPVSGTLVITQAEAGTCREALLSGC